MTFRYVNAVSYHIVVFTPDVELSGQSLNSTRSLGVTRYDVDSLTDWFSKAIAETNVMALPR
jgi:hypothetical protein